MEVGDAQRFRRLLKENADLRRIIRKLTSAYPVDSASPNT
jgi:hypothetical protein